MTAGVGPSPFAVENTGVAGCTRSQILRLSVANLTGRDQRAVRIQLMFHDSEGNLVKEATPTVMPGHIAFLDLDCGLELPTRADLRAQIRASWGTPPDDTKIKVPVAASLEGINPDGSTYLGMRLH